MKRLATALLLAPLWVPFLLAVATALFWPVPHILSDTSRLSWIWTATSAGALLGYAAVLAIGLPSHIWLGRRGHRSLRAYLVTWFVLSVIAWVIGFIAAFAMLGPGFALSYLMEVIVHRPYVPLAFGTMWAVVGATFWAIVRPDR
ncbi:hypothetical protein G6M50_23110 [Agrobacterium rhizogenes]|nr:hypothetical protein [Rhizobium rhizogenes]NTJ80689.1 hypothetical protein [Rhizobium rhizogenes]